MLSLTQTSGTKGNIKPPSLGLKNVGNSCFLNAVLQSFASIRSFRTYLQNQLELPYYALKMQHRSIPLEFRERIAFTLDKTIRDLDDCDKGPFKPPVAEVTTVKEKFMNKEQHDAHELLQFILDKLISEGSEVIQKTGLSLMGALDIKIKHDHLPFVGFLKNSLQCDNCRRVSPPSYQQFVDLSLSIPEYKSHVSLEECLKYFTASETVYDTNCSEWVERNSNPFDSPAKKRCLHSGRSRAQKQLSIARAPKTLCLHIRRLVGSEVGLVKLNCHINFPLELDLAPYCSFGCGIPSEKQFETIGAPAKNSISSHSFGTPPAFSGMGMPRPRGAFGTDGLLKSLSSCVGGDDSYLQRSKLENGHIRPDLDNPPKNFLSLIDTKTASLRYQLVSVIEHHGNQSGGHYTVFRKLFSEDNNPRKESWFHISDEIAQPVSVEEVRRSNAYMLYYERLS